MSEGNSELTIRTDSGPDELLVLLDRFGHDDALRGRVRPAAVRVGDGQMSGGVYEALGAGGFGSAPAGSLTTWVTYRRSEVRLTLTRDDGSRLGIDTTRVDPRQVLRDLLDPPDTRR